MVDFGRSDDVRKRNRGRILSVLRRQGAVSRKDIGMLTGLSASTVSAITSELLDERSIRQLDDNGNTKSSRGRPQIRLELDADVGTVAAIVLQVDALSVVLSDYAGNRIAERGTAISALRAAPDDFAAAMVATLRSVLQGAAATAGPLQCIQLGVQGVTDVAGETMLWSPITRHRSLPFSRVLRGAFSAPVRVSNDCSMIASALHWREPEHYGSNYGVVLLSHGIGMGLILNDELMSGTRSSGTEFGHISHIPRGALCRCGRHGCIEAYAGDYAIFRRARGEGSDTPPRYDITDAEMDRIYEAARSGDANALAAYREAGHALGTGLADVFALVDPFPIAFVGKGTKAFAFIEAPLREALADAKMAAVTQETEIRCYPDERPLIEEGCLISALQKVDEQRARTPLHQGEALPHAI